MIHGVRHATRAAWSCMTGIAYQQVHGLLIVRYLVEPGGESGHVYHIGGK